jgi:hypothetical protein
MSAAHITNNYYHVAVRAFENSCAKPYNRKASTKSLPSPRPGHIHKALATLRPRRSFFQAAKLQSCESFVNMALKSLVGCVRQPGCVRQNTRLDIKYIYTF